MHTCSHSCSSLFWFRMESRSSSLSVSCSIVRSSISPRASTFEEGQHKGEG